MPTRIANPIWQHFAGCSTSVPFTTRSNGNLHHHWPSNFFIEPDGTCVESEYQAEKFSMFGNPFTANAVARMPPGKAKRWGRSKIKLDKRQQAVWERNKREVMLHFVMVKFEDHTSLLEKLLDTHGIIVEENTWHDNEWGHCICANCRWTIGKNMLGKILMDVREHYGGVAVEACVPTWYNFDATR